MLKVFAIFAALLMCVGCEKKSDIKVDTGRGTEVKVDRNPGGLDVKVEKDKPMVDVEVKR